jgi:hypothetical protein
VRDPGRSGCAALAPDRQRETKIAQHFSSWRFNPDGPDLGGAEFAFMGFPAGDTRVVAYLIKPKGRPNFYLHTAFPWLANGVDVSLRVDQIDTDHFAGRVHRRERSWEIGGEFLRPPLRAQQALTRLRI